MKFRNLGYNRREFLKTSFLGSTYFLTIPGLLSSSLAKAALRGSAFNIPDLEINLKAFSKEISLLTGAQTKALCYEAEVLKGDTTAVSSMGEGFLGPLIRLKQGQKVTIRFQNDLPEKSIIHWHGLHLPEAMDSHPSYAIESGQSYDYEFVVNQRPGFYWYHPHPHGRTAYQMYHGLAGMLIVESDEEKKLGLPTDEFDLAFCIQDRLFDDSNQFSYLPRGGHDLMMGMMGDTLFINGKQRTPQKVLQDAYRIRLLNASNARFYKLAWSDGQPLQIIGTDGGLLEQPVERPYLYLAPGERLELFRNFRNTALGEKVELLSVPIQEGRGNPFTVISFDVVGAAKTQKQLPHSLMKVEKLNPQDAVNFDSPKRFAMEMTRGQGWTIDGLTYEMRNSRPKETVQLNTMEIWEFESRGMMAMPHPVHIHGSQFQVLSRSGDPDPGFLDVGWKDTVFIWGGQTVQIIKRFDDFTGYFPFHCHNLEHGAMGMMRDFNVVK